jgi:hypothetical protein
MEIESNKIIGRIGEAMDVDRYKYNLQSNMMDSKGVNTTVRTDIGSYVKEI